MPAPNWLLADWQQHLRPSCLVEVVRRQYIAVYAFFTASHELNQALSKVTVHTIMVGILLLGANIISINQSINQIEFL